jgi:hypothetical protein
MRAGPLVLLILSSAACQSTPRELGAFTIRPIPPSLSVGSGKAVINGAGDLVLTVSLRGPAGEITRTARNGQLEPNLIWHLVEGDCAAWSRNDTSHTVLIRWTIQPESADVSEFTYVVPRSFRGDLGQPHALAAFRNGGGGPLYVCGDMPPAT